MLVQRRTLAEVLRRFEKTGFYGLDTETTGLREEDSLFSIILADEQDTYYLNFNPDAGTGAQSHPDYVLDRSSLGLLQRCFDNRDSTWFIQNAKFDMRMLAKEGLTIHGIVHCTEAMARVQKNNRMGHRPYSLASLAREIGMEKSTAVEEYVSKHKLYTDVELPGKKTRTRLMHYERVPFELMHSYGEMDGKIVRALGIHQLEVFAQMTEEKEAPPIWPVVHNERALTKVCFAMERRGVRINRPYVEAALHYELGQAEKAIEEFELATGIEFIDGPKCLTLAFDKLGERYPTTEKGNPSFTEEVLSQMTSPVASMVNKIRKHSKIAGTYYSSFLHQADREDVIRADIRQAGTETGRFSYREPNLQNVPKEESEEDLLKPYQVRASFVPRPEHCFVMIDYQQQEFRLILDYTGEKRLIEAVMAGADVHQATADEVGISRKEAKVINFGLAYGMGVALLAANLYGTTVPLHLLTLIWKKNNSRERLSPEEKEIYATIPPEVVRENLQKILKAQGTREKYFSRLPKLKRFFKDVMKTAEKRGYVWNWAGRRCHIDDPAFSYIAPNHIIQGGGADVIKHAMVQLDRLLAPTKSAMLVQVHDEILFELHKDELDLVPGIVKIMENVYPSKNGMKLTTSVEHSWVSWGAKDKTKGAP